MFFRRKTKENHAKSVQNVRKLLFSLGKTKEKQKTCFFRRKTKENHAKSVQNVRKLLFSLGKTKEKQNKKKRQTKKRPPKKIHPFHTWVVVKIRVVFWVPIKIRHLIFRVPQKGP